jgi:protocatechuate 3,4-dioxygenase beta subunit
MHCCAYTDINGHARTYTHVHTHTHTHTHIHTHTHTHTHVFPQALQQRLATAAAVQAHVDAQEQDVIRRMDALHAELSLIRDQREEQNMKMQGVREEVCVCYVCVWICVRALTGCVDGPD